MKRKPTLSWGRKGYEYYFTTPGYEVITLNKKQGETLNPCLMVAGGAKFNGPFDSEFKVARAIKDLIHKDLTKIMRWREKETARKTAERPKRQPRTERRVTPCEAPV